MIIRRILSVICSFIIGGVMLLHAQSNKFEKEWNVGAGFGVSMSQASFGTSSSSAPFKTSLWQQYQGGFSLRYLTEKNLGLLVELNFSQQGWKQKFEDEDGEEITDYQHQHQLNYLNIPFLTHIYWGNKVRFFINLGPQIGFLLSENEKMNDKLKDDLSNGVFSSSQSTGQFFNKADRIFDYGIVAGLGLELRTGIGHFAIEGRYTFGLGDFYNNSKADHFQRSANKVIGVRMTYYTKLF